MRHRIRIASTAAAVFLCWSAPAIAQGRGAARTFRHSRFTLSLPAGWRVADWKPARGGRQFVPARHPRAQEHARVVHFADGRGDFFSVHVDQATDFEADAIWTVKVATDLSSVDIRAEGAMCRKSADPRDQGPCSAGNGSLEIGTLPALAIRGHTYSFEFGNTRREGGVDLEPFRYLLQSFRAR